MNDPNLSKQNTARCRLAACVNTALLLYLKEFSARRWSPKRGIWNTQSGTGWGGGRWCLWLCLEMKVVKSDKIPTKTPPSSFTPYKKMWYPVGLDVLSSWTNTTTSKKKWIHIRDKETSYWERWLKDTVHALLICNEHFKCWWTKIHTGVETLFEKGVVHCVLIVKVQFDAWPLFVTDCFSEIVTNYNREVRIKLPIQQSWKTCISHPIFYNYFKHKWKKILLK